MYTPKPFEESSPDTLAAFMRKNAFALLLTTAPEMSVSHVPLLLDQARGPHGTLRGHLALANPQCQALHAPFEAMAVFQGPHAYISPSWYQTKLAVPTWNYTAVHAYGHPKILQNPAQLRQLLQDLVHVYESAQPTPWKMDSLPAEFLDQMEKHIVGFEIQITRLEGNFKLNQNRSPADQQGVVKGLLSTGNPIDAQVAQLMSQNLRPDASPPAFTP